MPDPNAQLQVQLYSKLAASLSVAGVVGQDPESLLSLQIPGLYIRPHLNVDDPETQYYVANALDGVLACNWVAMRKPGTVSDVYKSVLDGKETPLVKLSPEQRQALDQAIAYLFDGDGDPSPAYRAYLDCQLAYLQALDDYEAAAATEKNGGGRIPPQVTKRLREAERAWRDDGNRSEVDAALGTIEQYEALEPAAFWRRLAERYGRFTRIAGKTSEFQFVTSNPPYQVWFQEFGWSDFRFDQTDFDNQSRSGGVGVDEPVCCCSASPERPPLGPPSAALAVAGASAAFEPPPGFTDFLLTCRLRRIEIVRPWMDLNVFWSRAWRWSPASVSFGVALSSGGDIAGRVMPNGVMPVLPTTAVLARDVVIEWSDPATPRALAAHAAAGRSIRLGPFRLDRARFDGEHRITMPDPQLIGYISWLLPKCPNPDPTLPWPLTAVREAEW